MHAFVRRLSWLVQPVGRVDRVRFLLAGATLLAIKVALDAALCAAFELPWRPTLYWAPLDWRSIATDNPAAALAFAAVAVPFGWIGACLSIRRLRDAGMSPWFAVLFAIPFVNVTLVAVLLLLPEEPARPAAPPQPASPPRTSLSGPLPAVAAALLTLTMVWLAVVPLGFYGGALFLGTPFAQGMFVGLLAGPRGIRFATGQLLLSGAICAGGLLLLGIEGLLCIAMAAPLWFVLAWLGTALGTAVTRGGGNAVRRAAPALLVAPLGEWAEPTLAPPPSVFEVTTVITVDAPPAEVWRHLVAFSELPPPTEAVFRLGIAYPVHATIEGTGVGAIRRCSFSTGDFVEPIEIWDEPRLLRFSVLASPQPMVEWNPFHDHVDAHHLHGFFQARRGQFELVPRADGGTELRGTTWYSHGLWPEGYWAWWSEHLVHTIHHRVLRHIADGAEAR
ncbi:MAG: DUF805 domain-containing protein [Planctomycetes bacterium]|nr:DUF805 domain-containing protein [Planctomycetota bacterium]